MRELSIFEIIGPNMIGPSSSHTAGALRIALMACKMVEKKIVKAEFTLYGSFAKTYKGHGTDRALVAGLMGFQMNDPRIKNSFKYADEQNIKYSFKSDFDTITAHPNTVGITLTCEDNSTLSVLGESVGGGMSVIRQINGVDVKLSGKYNTILIEHMDTTGILAYITLCLSNFKINIAFARLYREHKGEKAYTIVETDDQIPAETITAITVSPDVIRAMRIEL